MGTQSLIVFKDGDRKLYGIGCSFCSHTQEVGIRLARACEHFAKSRRDGDIGELAALVVYDLYPFAHTWLEPDGEDFGPILYVVRLLSDGRVQIDTGGKSYSPKQLIRAFGDTTFGVEHVDGAMGEGWCTSLTDPSGKHLYVAGTKKDALDNADRMQRDLKESLAAPSSLPEVHP